MGIYQHFRTEEHPFIDQVISWKNNVEKMYQHRLTDFLDPREQQIVQSIIGTTNDELQLKFHGGGKFTERKRAIIAPFYEDLSVETFQLSLLQASFNEKFNSIVHPDVMGAFLSLGIDRSKFGDIFVSEGKLQIVVASEIVQYVIANLTSIKNANITLSETSLENLDETELHWLENDIIVSSLRLDVVLSGIYNMSRKEAALYLKKKQVKVNFKLVENGTFELEEGDLISVRRKGRSKLVKINGGTRKGKLRITTAILK